MKSREHYLFRAACLRDIQSTMPDPLARFTLEALIQALEEAASDLEQPEAAECLQ
jgi:hypothetical protein